MVLTKAQMERILNVLQEKGAYKGPGLLNHGGQCEACQKLGGYMLVDKTGLQTFGGEPAVMLYCTNCGNVRFHVLKALGLEDL